MAQTPEMVENVKRYRAVSCLGIRSDVLVGLRAVGASRIATVGSLRFAGFIRTRSERHAALFLFVTEAASD